MMNFKKMKIEDDLKKGAKMTASKKKGRGLLKKWKTTSTKNGRQN